MGRPWKPLLGDRDASDVGVDGECDLPTTRTDAQRPGAVGLPEGVEDDYRRLVNEVMRLLLTKELFVFVTTEGVVGNNNASERELRDDAQRRDTGRTNKKPTGAKRQSIIASVLRTLGKQLSKFTLDSVLTEIQRWAERGRSCFTDQAKAAGLNHPPPDSGQRSLLDRIVLDVDKPEMAAA